jgi:serine/threonine protein phosphatase 1
MPRTFAIGDVHGCSVALAALLAAIKPQPEDTIVTLGDYVNRGHDSKGVIDQLLKLESRCTLMPVLGNHDATMLGAFDDDDGEFRYFMEMGGITTLDSYGDSGRLDQVPREHRDFLRRCRTYYETATHFFCHANYDPAVALAEQDDRYLIWLSLRDNVPGPHCSGKIAVVGHTPQASGKILDLGHLLCVDTGCVSGGRLTALDVESGHVWSVDEVGQIDGRPVL